MRWAPLVATAVIGAIGFERYLDDAAFWVDETIIADSIRNLSVGEIFGPLGLGKNSFPRFYLLALSGMNSLFGYETLVLRALPIGFYLVATYLWLRVLFSRLGAFPLLVGLAFCLNLLPTSWFAYGSMLKQYTFDVFLSTMLFAISDRYFDRSLREGRSLWLCLALGLPCALSYTYGIVLVGRLAGWYVGGLTQRDYRLAPSGVAALGIGVIVSSTSLWFTDIQFMADSVYGWWASCQLGNDWSSTPALLGKFGLGWYSGLQEFPIAGGLPKEFLVILQIAFVAGVFQVLRTLTGRSLPRVPDGWGTRSLGALFVLFGVLAASFLLRYPICSGRLTLFALLPLQLVLFEGFVAAHSWLENKEGLKKLSLALGLVWIGCVAPFGIRDVYRFSHAPVPDDIRAVLGRIQTHSDLEILVMPCLAVGARSLPGGLPSISVVYAPSPAGLPWGKEVLILEKNRHPGLVACFNHLKILEKNAATWQELHTPADPVRLYRASFPLTPP